MTTWDYGRLSAVVDAFQRRGRGPLVDLLAEELDRAELVEPAVIPRDVVTMHSCVEFVDDDTGEVRTATLVYPGEEDSRRGKIAVVTPVGSALLGLRAGATIAWRTLDGRTKRLSVLEVRDQPEAHGFDGASSGNDRESTSPRPGRGGGCGLADLRFCPRAPDRRRALPGRRRRTTMAEHARFRAAARARQRAGHSARRSGAGRGCGRPRPPVRRPARRPDSA